MIDAEKLLGGLIKNGVGSGGALGTKAAAGVGLLGVAMAAFEHFSEHSSKPGATPPPPPPPPPHQSQLTSPPPPPCIAQAKVLETVGPEVNKQTILLIRAMIASAYADGELSQGERERIMNGFNAVGLSEEERNFVETEINNPKPMELLTAFVDSFELAQDVYAASLMAVKVDTDAERDYLKRLADRLHLPPDCITQIHEQCGVENI